MTQGKFSKSPKSRPMVGSAVATIVWFSAARNMARPIPKMIRRTSAWSSGGGGGSGFGGDRRRGKAASGGAASAEASWASSGLTCLAPTRTARSRARSCTASGRFGVPPRRGHPGSLFGREWHVILLGGCDFGRAAQRPLLDDGERGKRRRKAGGRSCEDPGKYL